jgi:tRNA(Ile)-lysidine synthase TilS/MesJ
MLKDEQAFKALMRPIRTRVGQAIGKFELISAHDRICIGFSGGKDSTILLHVLSDMKRYSPVPFSLTAVHIGMGWGHDPDFLQQVCVDAGIPFHYEKTDIGEIVFSSRNERNPCSLCANMRRGALNNVATDLGCNKVALGHHLDDLLETFLLSMSFEGRLHTFSPSAYLTRKELTVIRPLILVPESDIITASKCLGIPSPNQSCPIEGNTKRDSMKKTIHTLSQEIPDLRQKWLAAIQNNQLDEIWSKE